MIVTCTRCQGAKRVPHRYNETLTEPCTRCAGTGEIWEGEVALTPFPRNPPDTPAIRPVRYAPRLFSEVKAQLVRDRRVWAGPRVLDRPMDFTSYDEDGNYVGYRHRYVHTWSPLAWSVTCPVKDCEAGVDQQCRMATGHTHSRRILKYQSAVNTNMPNTARPAWYKHHRARHAQRQAIVQIEQSAYEVSMARYRLGESRADARDLNVDERMIRRAADHGHKRAAKEIHKWSARKKEQRRARRQREGRAA